MLVALGGVVEHDVEDDLDAVPVQLLDQRLQLVDLHAELAGGGVAGLGREEADGAVAPVVQQQARRRGLGRLFSNSSNSKIGSSSTQLTPSSFR